MPSHKTVEIRVAAEYELPDLYNHKDTHINEEALTLGAFLHEQMTCRRTNANVQRLEEQKAKEIATIKEKHAATIANLTTQLDANAEANTLKQRQLLEAQKTCEESARLGEREILTKQYDAKVKALTTDISVLTETNRGLLARRTQLEEERDRDIQTAVDRSALSFQRELDEKERTIKRLEGMITSLTDSYNTMNATVHQFSEENLKKTLNSRNKGTEYENIIVSKLKLHYGSNPTFSLIEKSKSSTGHEADIIMDWNDKKVLWEAKNYSTTVPKGQVDKFQNDMKTSPNILIGIMMSRYTPIVGKASRGDFYTEMDGDQLLIYVSNSDIFGDSLYQLLPHLWTVHWEATSKNVRHEDEDRDKVLRIIDGLIAGISKRRTEWLNVKSHFMKGINWMTDMIDEDEGQLKKALRLLKSGDKESSTMSVSDILFTDPNGDRNLEDTIILLKKIISPANDSSIVLNDLASAVRDLFPEPKPSIEVTKTRIRAVLPPAMVEAIKGKSIIVNGLKLVKG